MDPRLTYTLAVCFGVSSWVTINGIFSILPLIIDKLPEGWALASTLGLAIQAANIGPLVYRLSRPNFQTIPDIVYGILALGTVSMLLLACFWDVTVKISGTSCSIMLILLTFTAALCDCTSSLIFWPFIGMFAPPIVSGLALGENLSGVVAMIVSWLGLSPGGSFCALAMVLILSAAAFSRLCEAVSSVANVVNAEEFEALDSKMSLSPTLPYLVVGLTSLFENAVLPSVLPYATARYSLKDYHIASTLPVGPLALFTLLYFQASRTAVAMMATGAAFAIGLIMLVGLGYVDVGAGLAILLVLVTKVLLAYSKAASMYHLKVGSARNESAQKHLETAGGMMQVWSLGGAVIMFVLTHYTTIFPKQY